MNPNARLIQMTATAPDPVEVKRVAIRIALISIALLGMLTWNGFLIFIAGRMVQLW